MVQSAGEGARRLGGLTALALVLAGASAPPRGEAAGYSLEAVLEQLARRAGLYEKAAVGFSCAETVLVGKFSARKGENRREEKTRYNYLYEGSPQAGYREIRLLLGKNGSPRQGRVADPDLPVPGAYDWALLFTEHHRPHFRFEPAGSELVGLKSTYVLSFSGAAAWESGKKLEEWSGKVWVERETGNFVKIVAAPNHQDDLLPLRMAEWLKGVRLGGVPLKRQPRGVRYRLSFTVEKLGLTFPGEAETRLFVLTSQDVEEIRERIAQTFQDYAFFNVQSEEEFQTNPPAPRPPSP